MSSPTISLIISCSTVERQARACLDAIRSTQPIGAVELFLVCWEGVDYSRFAGGFHSVTTVHFPRSSSLNVARSRAVRMATADIVVVTEDHARFDGAWVEQLPVLFAQHAADGVGWTVLPVDRTSYGSWCGYFVEYAVWGPGIPEGPLDMLPGHNCAYRRSALMEHPDLIEHWLQAEYFYHRHLRRQGRTLYFTTRFTVYHGQFHSLKNFAAGDFWYGWGFGYTRLLTEHWGPGRRLLYALAIPLKVPMRWWILLRMPLDRRELSPGFILRHAAGITLGYAAGAAGEFCAYLFGPGKAHTRLTRYEVGFDRSIS